MRKRRYEILLPLKHNDGRPVSDAILNLTRRDLLNRFDGISFQPQPVFGIWLHDGDEFEDAHAKVYVDVDDNAENHQFFVDFKAILLQRFEQIEIYMASYPIDIL